MEERTEGFEAMKEAVATYTPDYVETITGIPAEDLRAAARMYAGAKQASILYCMGITQHTTGTDNVKSLANLAMLCGHLGKRGGGVNPLRGQNNVQGACDMGGLPNVYTGYQPVNSIDALQDGSGLGRHRSVRQDRPQGHRDDSQGPRRGAQIPLHHR